jgi:hypothetical protein
MKREDFIFTIGYQGNTAIIDGRARKAGAGASFRELAQRGLYKAAYCAVLQGGDAGEIEEFAGLYNARLQGRAYGREELSRLFGVYEVPGGISRTQIID